jgi:choline dehydrogenase
LNINLPFFDAYLLSLSRSVLFINAVKTESQTSTPTSNQTASNTYDYIVVGSGPGGGPLAARLAQAGFSVLLIDAGGDHGDDDIVRVPALNAQASEYTPIHWQFFVSHFDDPAAAQQDSKFTWQMPDGRFWVGPNPPAGSAPLGIYYPRTGTLGGCAEHNAMVMIYPAESDWDNIASVTGDDSWSAANMRQYWVKLENNQYLAPGTVSGHGFGGWLDISLTDLNLALKDTKVLSLIQGAATALGKGLLGGLLTTVGGLAQVLAVDLNNDSPQRDRATGLFQIPLAISNGPKTRASHRNLVLTTANAVNPDGSRTYALDIKLDTLVTRVLFDNASTPRAIGVEYLAGKHLYRADPNSASATPTGSGSFFANREVIISGGAFNTPQILKLSGIGPSAELLSHNIPVVLDAPAVGTNLQDRYEVGVVAATDSDFAAAEGCTFLNTTADPCFLKWRDDAADRGAYGTSGVALGVVHQSSAAAATDAAPDLIITGLAAAARGYFPGYSNRTSADARHWTWVVLKAHSRNAAGAVALRSGDPRDTPRIAFRSWARGGALDVQAAFEGVQLARAMFRDMAPLPLGLGSVFTEEVPGPAVESEADVKRWIMNEAWGHHACCTVPIGAADDADSVLDSRFRVKGVRGLRVVDASVFPKIPGLYIAAAVYMVSEKAAEVIIQDASL